MKSARRFALAFWLIQVHSREHGPSFLFPMLVCLDKM
jgi:hypothetical protein